MCSVLALTFPTPVEAHSFARQGRILSHFVALIFSKQHSSNATSFPFHAPTLADSWHARLVRYYSYFGFEPVAEVGGGELSDLPHMLVWGGAGTRMDANIPKMLAKWTPAFRSKRARASRPDDELQS